VPSQWNFDTKQLSPLSVLQSTHVVQSMSKPFFSSHFQWQSSVLYPCQCQDHPLSFEVIGDDFTATVANPFQCCHPFETQRGNQSWHHLEHLPALHKTVHTSKKCYIMFLLHLHRLHAPFQQFLLLTGFKTELHHHSFISWLLDNMILLCKIKQECTENCSAHADVTSHKTSTDMIVISSCRGRWIV